MSLVAIAKLGDYLPDKILGDNSHHPEVQAGKEPLMVSVLWIKQACEENVEECALHCLMIEYIKAWKENKKGKRLSPRDDIEALYNKLKKPRKEAQVQKKAATNLAKKRHFHQPMTRRQSENPAYNAAIVQADSVQSSRASLMTASDV